MATSISLWNLLGFLPFLLKVIFLLLFSKFHGLTYTNFGSLGSINTVLTLALLLLSPKVHGLNYEDVKSKGILSMLLHILDNCRLQSLNRHLSHLLGNMLKVVNGTHHIIGMRSMWWPS